MKIGDFLVSSIIIFTSIAFPEQLDGGSLWMFYTFLIRLLQTEKLLVINKTKCKPFGIKWNRKWYKIFIQYNLCGVSGEYKTVKKYKSNISYFIYHFAFYNLYGLSYVTQTFYLYIVYLSIIDMSYKYIYFLVSYL